MMHRALRVCCSVAALSWIGSMPLTLCAGPAAPLGHDRDDGIEVVLAARDAGKRDRDTKLATALDQGAEAYRKAKFAVAIDWYDTAIKLAPDRKDLNELLQLAIDKRNMQRTALEPLPKTPDEREQYYKKTLEEGHALFKKDDFAKAYETFYGLWLVAGDYDDTLKMMERSRKKGKLEQSSDTITAAAKSPAQTAQPAATEAKPDETRPAEASTVAAPTDGIKAATAEGEKVSAQSSKLKVDELILQAQFEAEHGNAQASRDLYAQAMKIDPNNKIAQRGLARLDEKSAGDPAQQKKAKVESLMAAGKSYAEQKKYDLAKSSYKDALALDRENPALLAAIDSLEKSMTETKPEKTVADVSAPAPAVASPETAKKAAEPPASKEESAPAPAAVEAPKPAAEPPATPAPAEEKPTAKVRPASGAATDEKPAAQRIEEAKQKTREAEEEAGKRRERERNEKIEALVAQGKAALDTKNLDLAEQSYREALSLDGSSRAAKKGLKEIESARNADAEKQKETQIKTALGKADDLKAAKRLDEARASYQSVLDADPKNKQAKSGIQEVARLAEKETHAKTEAAIESDMKVARDYMEQSKFTEARSTLNYILKQAPNYEPAAKELKNLDTMEAAAMKANADQAATLEAAAQKAGQLPPAAAAPAGAAAQPPAQPQLDIPPPVTEQARSLEVAQAQTAPPPQPSSTPAPPPSQAITEGQPIALPPPTAPKATKMAASGMRASKTAVAKLPAEQRQQLDALQERAMTYYHEGKLDDARKIWQEMLTIDPNDKRASTYLEQTQAEYERKLADAKAKESASARETAREALLNSPVTIQTDRSTPLSEFMRLISFSTVKEIEYYIANGAEASVFANFIDRPLKEVLDKILIPIGLTWEMDDKNLITIKTDLKSRTFNLTSDQMNKIRSLLDSHTLQTVIWGQETPPAKGAEMTLDERQRIFLVVGSSLHIQKIEDFLATLETAETPELETRMYQIRAEDGPKIKSLINALIDAEAKTPFQLERKLFIDGSDLVVRDTPENIIKIEELLLDEQFIKDLRNEKLDIANFSLVPRDVESQSSDQVRFFTRRQNEAIQTLLYAAQGKDAAAKEGRRLWFDDTTLQLTIVDTPSNIDRVGAYIESLPELRQRRLQKVVFLKNAVAEDLAAQMSSMLELEGATGAGGGAETGTATVKRLRRGDSFNFRDLRIRLIRVEGGDPNDRFDDTAQLSVVSGTTTSNLTIQELETQFFENYEITAENIQPAGSQGTGTGGGNGGQSARTGDGTVRLAIKYIPPIEGAVAGALPGGVGNVGVGGTAGRGGVGGTRTGTGTTTSGGAETGITINPYGSLNALVIRYDNPALFKDAQELIKQLDQPTKQVAVETKFVQVNENRAKEFSSDINFSGFGNGQHFNSDFWRLNSRFAQNVDEFRSTFEPPIENPLSANLIKGTTVLDLVFGELPSINFQLRLLEAEGVINVTSGPKITMLDGVQGDFRFERIGPAGSGGGGAQQGIFSSAGGGGGGAGATIFNPLGTGAGGGAGETLENEDSSQFNSRYNTAILLVTPEITSEKSIILQVIAELIDSDTNLGALFTATSANAQGAGNAAGNLLPPSVDQNGTLQTPVVDPVTGTTTLVGSGRFLAAVGQEGALLRTRKKVDTTARIENGGTIVLGGWTGEFTQELTSGIPVLRNMPYIGKLFFSRNQRSVNRTTLLVFLTGNIID